MAKTATKKLVVQFTEMDVQVLLGVLGDRIVREQSAGRSAKHLEFVQNKIYRAMGVPA